MKRRNIIIIIIAAITVFNIGAITALLYHQYGTEAGSAMPELQLPNRQYARWFQDQLNLNQAQFLVFRDANRTYHYEGRIILSELESLRLQMFEELNKENADSVKIEEYAMEIGRLHTELKKLTGDYYLQMKNVCNKSQKEKLYRIFKSMLDEEGNVNIPD